jgi:uncharacterized hydrophobic protein (TIGR00271 family)
MEDSMFQKIKKTLKYRFNLDEDKASEIEVLDNIKKAVEFKGINLWTLIFAIFIASIGLNVNSTAVIIGAMLISPLMGPIMGIGMGAGVFDFDLIKQSGKNLFIATLIGLLTSTLYFFLSPLHTAQSELLARTYPTIWDVLIAFFGGLAGIVASSRKKYNNVIPGVAIATALMPPLCTAGYGIATGQWNYFFGAFYLYIINSVFISIATFLIVRFLKFKPVNYVNAETSAKVRKWVVAIAVLTIIPSLYLAYHFVRNEMFTQNATRFITEEIATSNYTLINKKIFPDKNEIIITVIGDGKTDSLKKIFDFKKENFNLKDVNIIVKNSISQGENEEDINQLKEGIIENMFEKQEDILKEKVDEISNLKRQLLNQSSFEKKREGAIREFYALYGKPQELIIDQTINHTPKNLDTILVVYFKTNSIKFNNADLKKMEEWLKIKFNKEKIKIIME